MLRGRFAALALGFATAAAPTRAQPTCPPGSVPSDAFPGACARRDVLRERIDSLLRSDDRARHLAAYWLRDTGVDSAAVVLGTPLGSRDRTLQMFDAAGAVAGWPRLRDDTLHAGRELRVWAHSWGSVALRLTRHGEHVTGEMLGPPDTPLTYSPDACVNDPRERDANGDRWCLARFPDPPDWRALWDSLDAAGVWMLPDESSLRSTDMGQFDGLLLDVEARTGGAYRYYHTTQVPPYVNDAVTTITLLVADAWARRAQPPETTVSGALFVEGGDYWLVACPDAAQAARAGATRYRVLGLGIERDVFPADRTAARPLGAFLAGRFEAPREDTTEPRFVVERLLHLSNAPFCRD